MFVNTKKKKKEKKREEKERKEERKNISSKTQEIFIAPMFIIGFLFIYIFSVLFFMTI